MRLSVGMDAARQIGRSAIAAALCIVALAFTAFAAGAQTGGYDPRSWLFDRQANLLYSPRDLASPGEAPTPGNWRRIPPQVVSYSGGEAPGTIIVDTSAKRLDLILSDGRALRYVAGVGREGFSWSGRDRVSAKKQWPDWRPPANMQARAAAEGTPLPAFMAGGENNPLGARALYIGSTLYRIHGTNEPWTVGTTTSSGCIRLTNEDIIDLYERVPVGAEVIVRS